MAKEEFRVNEDEIVPGMMVEATQGDLGEHDVSPARVIDVKKDRNGEVDAIELEKGALFRKKLEVPADRIEEVDPAQRADGRDGQIVVGATEQELEALTALGEEELPSEEKQLEKGLLNQVEQLIPTAEGLREREQDIPVERPKNALLRIIGPGFLSGMAGNDSSAVTAYAINGATVGFSQLWLMLLSTPLYFAVQYACAKIGRVSQKGLSEILRERYGRGVSGVTSLLLIITNVALIAADLTAIGSGFELISGIPWYWFVLPVAALLWYLTVYRNFESLKKIFMVMSFAFVTYLVTAFFSHPNWGTVLFNTFVPHLDLSFAGVSAAVALLGATISPYSIFWQVQGEKEEERTGTLGQQVRMAGTDVATGVVSGNLIAYFIIVCTAATLFTHNKSINTAADAALALEPLLGHFARYLFAFGLIGAGVVAIPVLLASTSYAVSGTFGWPGGLSRRPWQNEGFYLILTIALIVGIVVAMLRINPIQLLFWANILAGILAPLLVLAIFLVGNNRNVMDKHRLSKLTNLGLLLIIAILLVSVGLLVYGLMTGK